MVNFFKAWKVQLGLALLLFVSITVGCKDDPSFVGESIMPKGDLIEGFSYTLPGIKAANVERKFVRSDKVGYTILGEFRDPLFGTSIGGFVTQVGNGARDTIIVDNTFSLDSVQLVLARLRGDLYSEKDSSMIVSVYELSKPLLNGGFTRYDSNTNMDDYYSESTLLGSKKYEKLNSHRYTKDSLRVDLTAALKERFIGLLKDTETHNNQAAFQEFFKGIYIKGSFYTGTTGSLMRVSAWGESCGIRAYYHHLIANKADTGHTKVSGGHLFPIYNDGTDFNLFKHDFAGSEIAFNNYEDNTKSLYAQGMAGSYVNVILPDLTNWKDSLKTSANGDSIGLSNIELELIVDTTKSEISKYFLPSSLELLRASALPGGETERPYYSDTTNVKNYNCFLSSGKGAVNASGQYSYKFILNKEFFKQIIEGKEAFSSLFIGPNNPSEEYRRVVFYGAQNGVVFNIKYVKYKRAL